MTHGRSGYCNHGCRCEICRAAWRSYMSEYRRRRVRAHLCVECDRTVFPGTTRCRTHLRRNSAGSLAAYHRRQAQNGGAL